MSENQQQEISNASFDFKKNDSGLKKTWIFVRDHVSLPNAFYNFPIAVSAIGSGAIDVIGRHSEYLLAGAVATGIGSVILYVGKKNKQSSEQIKKRLRLCLTAFGFTSVAACASYTRIAQHDHTALGAIGNVEARCRHAELGGIGDGQHRVAAVQGKRTAVCRGVRYRSSSTRKGILSAGLVEGVLGGLETGSGGRTAIATPRCSPA